MYPDGGNQTRQQNTGEPNNHGDQAREKPLWHQITVADGKHRNECEIQGIAEWPFLKKAE